MTNGTVIPKKVDPFTEAFRLLETSHRTGATRHFGAVRAITRHGGIDLEVAVNTPVQIPYDKVVLIGICTERNEEAGDTIGNGLIFFVPDKKQPYFLLLAHLSPRTFELLSKDEFQKLRDTSLIGKSDIKKDRAGKGYLSIGAEIVREPDGVIAYTGKSAVKKGPHLHISTVTEFRLGGQLYTANRFMDLYKNGILGDFLRGKNFYAIKPPNRERHPMSLEGYINPTELVKEGRLRISSLPLPTAEVAKTGKQKPVYVMR